MKIVRVAVDVFFYAVNFCSVGTRQQFTAIGIEEVDFTFDCDEDAVTDCLDDSDSANDFFSFSVRERLRILDFDRTFFIIVMRRW